ncbi:hypothetical protein VOLCADRAFT_106991 [Volvox carteri f. nagariensis]|uniref:Uncharacterized protein n=1 Tax=Volvox carteri f. nagariensis TaxID=3068 RepID=D8UB81_VOLCA|nr:uncharacterized protein VOLCADRAFT_106991 [Volvox carteri f. nagariensis]EFJ43064.1 hypothetical protein VOLCADRAFT_106991 [Volvox carteri f. nagariensis]|eukprot:XP_002955863.1 hypothetical protein VOLCADRAFT_106991 [Volvox carteri f. nagariensis]
MEDYTLDELKKFVLGEIPLPEHMTQEQALEMFAQQKVNEAMQKERQKPEAEKVQDVRAVLQQYAGTSVELGDSKFMNAVTEALGIRGNRGYEKQAFLFIREHFKDVEVKDDKFVCGAMHQTLCELLGDGMHTCSHLMRAPHTGTRPMTLDYVILILTMTTAWQTQPLPAETSSTPLSTMFMKGCCLCNVQWPTASSPTSSRSSGLFSMRHMPAQMLRIVAGLRWL